MHGFKKDRWRIDFKLRSLVVLLVLALLTAPLLHGAAVIRGVRLAIKAVEETFVTAFQEGSISNIVPRPSVGPVTRQAARQAPSAIAGVSAVSRADAQPVARPTSGSFVVETLPEDAQVRVMNIQPVYRPGMTLQFGSYDIEVSAPGYRTKRFPIEISETEVLVDVELSQRGSFSCEPDILHLGGIGLSDFGLQYRAEQVFENVGIYEVFSSLANRLDNESNALHNVQAFIGDDFAYLTAWQNSNLTQDQVESNERVEITDRALRQSYGLERDGNNIRFVHYMSLDGAYSTKEMTELAFCEIVESI